MNQPNQQQQAQISERAQAMIRERIGGMELQIVMLTATLEAQTKQLQEAEARAKMLETELAKTRT